MASVRKRKWKGGAGRKVGGRPAGECWEVSWNDGDKRRKKSGFATKAEAEAFAVERQKEVNDGLSRPAGHRMTLDQLVQEFLDHAETRVQRKVISRGHLINMTGHFQNYICRKPDWKGSAMGTQVKPFDGAIGHLLLARIRPATVEKLIDDLLAAGLSAGSVHQIKISLHSALDLARRRDYIPTNPADRIKIERSREEQNQRVTPPSIATVKRVIGTAEGPLRLAKIENHRTLAGNPGRNALVMQPEEGKDFLPPSWLRYRLAQVLDQLGLANDDDLNDTDDDDDEDGGSTGAFTWHALRHFAISSWIAQGMGLKAVQTYAGHADVTTTWNRYGHLFPDEAHWSKIDTATKLTLLPSTETREQ